LLVEAQDRASLARGLQGLLIRIAKALNNLWQRHGKVFADRYHDRITSGPWLDGWKETVRVAGLEALVRPITNAHTWLLSFGWRRHGLLSVYDMPAAG
jgi:hypothetical protein